MTSGTGVALGGGVGEAPPPEPIMTSAHRRLLSELGAALVGSFIEFEDPLVADLMSAIVGAMTFMGRPKLALIMLGAQVSVAMRNHEIRLAREPTPLRPLGWDEAPTEPFPYPDTAEYHYAMAEREREARGE